MWEHSLQLSGQPGPETGVTCAQVNVSYEQDGAHVREAKVMLHTRGYFTV